MAFFKIKSKTLFLIFLTFGFSFFSLCESADTKDYIRLDEIIKTYGGSYGKDEISKYPTWLINGHRVVFSTNTPTVSVDNKIIFLKVTPIEKDETLFLGKEFINEVFPYLNLKVDKMDVKKEGEPERKVEKNGSSEILKGDIKISFDLIRLTFYGTMVSFSDLKKSGNELEIKFPRGKTDLKETVLGEGIAKKVLPKGDGKSVSIILDENFVSYETIKLKNPERLVILLKGSGQKMPISKKEDVKEIRNEEKPFEKRKNSILVVVDPGHGGNDTGAIAKNGIMEKDLTLLYSQKLKDELEKEGIDVILTRNSDTFIPLKERTSIANFNNADLFISIHFNSSPYKFAKGSESYIMSKEASDKWSLEVAEKENLTSSTEGGENEINLILWNLAQNQFIVESTSIAGELQESLNTLFETKNRGVRQAPFAVLEGAMMPALLLEVCFLSNPDEMEKVKDENFIKGVISSIKEPILRFKERNVPPNSN